MRKVGLPETQEKELTKDSRSNSGMANNLEPDQIRLTSCVTRVNTFNPPVT